MTNTAEDLLGRLANCIAEETKAKNAEIELEKQLEHAGQRALEARLATQRASDKIRDRAKQGAAMLAGGFMESPSESSSTHAAELNVRIELPKTGSAEFQSFVGSIVDAARSEITERLQATRGVRHD